MKERPILFSGPMVRALLDGSKTQTRRIVKPQPAAGQGMVNAIYCGDRHLWLRDGPCDETDPAYEWRCPYGQPGDRLWVRETFVQGWDYDPITDRIKQCDADGKQLPTQTWYRADGADIGWCDADGWQANTPWKPSIHMPRAASRITLEITSVRIERLQDISEADAMAEGATPIPDPCDHVRLTCADIGCSGPQPYRVGFRSLWQSINGPDSWAANPWVWVVSFKRLP